MLVITALRILRQGNDSDLLGYVVSEVKVRRNLSNKKKQKIKNFQIGLGVC